MSTRKTTNWWQHLGRFVLVASLLGGGWVAFLWLAGTPPLDTTSSLIMTWATLLVLFVVMFPSLLDRLKKIKLKDVELELRSSVEEAKRESPVFVADLTSHYSLSEKAGLDELDGILRSSARNDAPLLLIVDLGEGDRIFLPALFVYLAELELRAISTIVLFVAARGMRDRGVSGLTKASVIGATTAKKILFALYRQFPGLESVSIQRDDQDTLTENNPRSPSSRRARSRRETFSAARTIMTEWGRRDEVANERNASSRTRLHLSGEEVRRWLGNQLSSRAISDELGKNDLDTIGSAIAGEDEFVLTYRDEVFLSVTPICRITSQISQRALRDN